MRARRRVSPGATWWREAFEKGLYPLERLAESPAIRSRTRAEAAFAAKTLNLTKGARILDMPCGTGRHALHFARKGLRVTGADISARYLRAARRRAREAGLKIRWLKRDMRSPGFHGEFDAAVNLFTSFGYFLNEAEDTRALRGVFDALKPGGLFLIEVVNGSRVLRQLREKARRGEPVRFETRMEDGLIVSEESRLLEEKRAVETRWTFLDGARRNELLSFVRLYDGPKLERALEKAGFRVLRLFGGLDGSRYDARRSRRLAILSKKPTSSRSRRGPARQGPGR